MSESAGINHLRRIEHDLRHQVSTIGALASLISISPDAGDQSRWRSLQLLTELTWLDELINSIALSPDSGPAYIADVAVDELVPAVVEAVSATSRTRITVDLRPVTAAISRVDLWRALRNLVLNATSAAGRNGHVAIEVREHHDDIMICIDDDGPGFRARETDVAERRGLQIVREIAAAAGGQVDIGVSPLGGCRARLRVPRAARAGSPTR